MTAPMDRLACHVRGDAARVVLRQHLGLHRLSLAISRVEVEERLAFGVADDPVSCRRAMVAESGGGSSSTYQPHAALPVSALPSVVIGCARKIGAIHG
jgi:hypothetical protein